MHCAARITHPNLIPFYRHFPMYPHQPLHRSSSISSGPYIATPQQHQAHCLLDVFTKFWEIDGGQFDVIPSSLAKYLLRFYLSRLITRPNSTCTSISLHNILGAATFFLNFFYPPIGSDSLYSASSSCLSWFTTTIFHIPHSINVFLFCKTLVKISPGSSGVTSAHAYSTILSWHWYVELLSYWILHISQPPIRCLDNILGSCYWLRFKSAVNRPAVFSIFAFCKLVGRSPTLQLSFLRVVQSDPIRHAVAHPSPLICINTCVLIFCFFSNILIAAYTYALIVCL